MITAAVAYVVVTLISFGAEHDKFVSPVEYTDPAICDSMVATYEAVAIAVYEAEGHPRDGIKAAAQCMVQL